jgi:hypothetical protein
MTPGALLEPHGRLLELVDEVWPATATENPPSSIEKTQVGFGWVANVQNNRVSIKRGGFFSQKVGFTNEKNESLWKIDRKITKNSENRPKNR